MVAYNLVDDEVVIEGKEGRIRWAISREFIEVVVRSHNCRIIDICEIDSEDSFIHEGLDCEELNIRPPFISHYFVGLFWKLQHTSQLKFVDLINSHSWWNIALHHGVQRFTL